MAEVYFRHLCKQCNIDVVSVVSAGIQTTGGCNASEMAKKAMELEGLSLCDFKSTQIDEDCVRRASIIVGMTKDHVRQVVRLFPFVKDKTRTLMSFSGSTKEIHDPFGSNFNEFRECFDTMKPALHDLFEQVRAMLMPS